MKTLLIHHLESMWSDGYEMYDTSFEKEAEKVINYILKNDFDRVVLVRFEDHELGEEHYDSGLSEFVDDVEVYGYGWEREQALEDDPEGEGIRWAEGDAAGHSEVVMLDDWIKDLKGQQVTLVGAFENECISTVSAALDHCNIDYERKESLIVGTGVGYDLVLTEDEIQRRLQEEVESALSGADHHEAPEWPDKPSALPILHRHLAEAECDEIADLRHDVTEELLGIANFDTVQVGLDDLHLSQDVLEATEALALSSPDDIDNLEAPEVLLVGDKLTVDPDDYPLIKLYQDYGIENIVVQVDMAENCPYAHYGFSLESEKDFERTKRRLANLSCNQSAELSL